MKRFQVIAAAAAALALASSSVHGVSDQTVGCQVERMSLHVAKQQINPNPEFSYWNWWHPKGKSPGKLNGIVDPVAASGFGWYGHPEVRGKSSCPIGEINLRIYSDDGRFLGETHSLVSEYAFTAVFEEVILPARIVANSGVVMPVYYNVQAEFVDSKRFILSH